MAPARSLPASPPGKWPQLLLLALAELCAMALWFSASAVVPQLDEEWALDGAARAWLTAAVQVGFVAGALTSAILNLADRLSLRALIAGSAVLGALANAAIPLAGVGPDGALALRFLTGFALAGVYPPGMKLVASWTRGDRGMAIGLLVAALTLGSGLPHLLNAVPLFGEGGLPPWRHALLGSSGVALFGAGIVALAVRPGPWLASAPPFDWRLAARGLTRRPTRLANFGYLGHMWELYAVWTWVPVFLMASFEAAGGSVVAARLAAFGHMLAGAAGSLAAGVLADRLGRTRVAGASLLVSGSCCLFVGLLFDSPALATVACLVWGFAVVADSAQFSAAVSELADPRTVGTALTMQTCLGFLLTLFTIRIVPPLVEWSGWPLAFAALSIGPAFGLASMVRLRGLPEAERMASGNR